jgi:tetratricopeptide (TPR) repeat protein
MSQGRKGSRAGAALLAAGLLFAHVALAETEEAARRHASKGHQLAAKNKCKAAIFAFTRALKTLNDPTLRFNRAECFRKVGRTDEAITDYEQYLLELPTAPNRAAVEARIAALKADLPPRPTPAAAESTTPEPKSPAPPPSKAAPPEPAASKPEDKPAGAPARKAEKWTD